MMHVPDLTATFSWILITLVAGLRDDTGFSTLHIDNSHIVLKSPRIDRIVALGPAALQPLLDEMAREYTSLDTFARCYSACDQILRAAGLKDDVRWNGGHIKIEEKRGRVVGLSRIDGDSIAFRREQVREVIRRAKEVNIRLREKPFVLEPAPDPSPFPVADVRPGAVVLPQIVRSGQSNAALVVQLPAAAEIWVRGKKGEGQPAAEWALTSPALMVGAAHTFELKVRWKVDGKTFEVSRSVTVAAGNRSRSIVISGTEVKE
jgi:uncharacterized protein (TIGR03000 family)